ncbi:MAG: hypothetical protein OXF93_20985 [Acidobacteria bacterium]|nr:hypothetical protein [Acidobacteriota bacterium]
MHKLQNRTPSASRQAVPMSLADADITTARVDRRSFLWRAVAAGSVAAGAALTAACPSGTDSDGEGDAAPTDSDQSQ